MLLMGLLVFCAAFFSVFLLGLNSKILRDDHIMLGAMVSWFITVAQYYMTWAVIHAGLTDPEYIIFSGMGGCSGITAAQYFYRWLDQHHLGGKDADTTKN